MKIFLFITTLLILGGCASSSSDKSKEVKETKAQLTGAYGEAAELSVEDRAMFDKAISTIDDYTDIEPLSVSTQVVAGMNYRFSCTAKDKAGQEVKGEITIFKPLPHTAEEPSVTKVQF